MLGGQFLLQDILRQGFALLAAHPAAATRVLDGVPPGRRAELQQWLLDVAGPIATTPRLVSLGLPAEAIRQLAVCVTQEESPELPQSVAAGLLPDPQQVGAGWARVATFRTTYRVVCMATDDMEQATVLGLAVAWILLYGRETLQSPDYGYGLMQQQLAVGDLGRAEYIQDGFAFGTYVTLQATTYAETNTGDTPVTTLEVAETVTFTDAGGHLWTDSNET